jgi:hypothetical protein
MTLKILKSAIPILSVLPLIVNSYRRIIHALAKEKSSGSPEL